MPTQLTQPLPAVAPVRNPLRATFADPADLASGREGISEAEVRLQIEDVPGSGQYRTIGEYLNPYDYDSDVASVYLHRALLGTLKFAKPSIATGHVLHPLPDMVKRYRVQSRDLVDGEPVGEFNTQGPYHAWMGGKSFVNNQTDLTSGKAYVWLSTKPTTRRYFPGEFLLLCFLPLESGSVNLHIIKTPITGEPETVSEAIGNVTAFQPVQLNLTIDTTGLRSFSVGITGLIESASVLLFNVAEKPEYLTHLIYGNSLGGYDVLPMTGRLSFHNEPSGEVIETPLDPDHDGSDSHYRTFNQKAVDSITLRTGYLTLNERRNLRDMALMNEVYLYRSGTLRKLILENTAQLINTEGEFLYSAEFTARYAFDNHAYNNNTL